LTVLGRIQANAAADDQRTDDPGHTGRADARAKHRGQHGQRHADHAEQVAAARGFLVGQAAQAQDEKNGAPM
jgi:hypothetical protein